MSRLKKLSARFLFQAADCDRFKVKAGDLKSDSWVTARDQNFLRMTLQRRPEY